MCVTGINILVIKISLNKIIGKFGDSSGRKEVSKELAIFFGAEEIILFIEDEEVESILPAPGFDQTFLAGIKWQEFLYEVKNRKSKIANLKYRENKFTKVSAYTDGQGGYIAFINGMPSQNDVQPLLDLMPLISSLLKKEYSRIIGNALITTANSEAQKAQRLSTGLDIARKKLKDALIKEEKSARALRHLMNQKDEFMNIVSHELKTPMTSMKGYIQVMEMLIKANKTEKVQGYIEKANKQVDKLNTLVSDLLDVTKINSGKLEFNFSEFKLNELIYDCVEQNQNISNHQIRVLGEKDIKVNADKNRLEQVINNLISNAIKYSPGKKNVDVRIIDNNTEVRVEVQDEGIGIAKENQPFVFDRFFRSESVESKFFGLGLGLFISSEIIKRHNGEIGVESEYGKGSTFWFTLPLRKTL